MGSFLGTGKVQTPAVSCVEPDRLSAEVSCPEIKQWSTDGC